MIYEIEGLVFMVTGGASGLGALTVRNLLAEGAKHVVFLDIAVKEGISLENELKLKHGDKSVKFVVCDITKDDQLNGAYDFIVQEYGYLDAVINNAGIMNDSPESYKKEIDLNVTALITNSLKAIELMRKDRGGRGGTVINISSIAAFVHSPLLPVYSATKSAVLHFGTCIGMESQFARTGVRVLTVCFGVTDTSLIQKAKYGGMDNEIESDIEIFFENALVQKPESAVRCVLEAFKRGKSASIWLAQHDKAPVDMTPIVTSGYSLIKELLQR